MESSSEVPQKTKNEQSYDPAIPLLGKYPEKTIVPNGSCTPMCTATVYTITKTRKQPKCPSINEWIKKMWYIYTM